MAVDYYVGRSIEELEGFLKRAQDAKSRGLVTEVSAAGIRTVRSRAGLQSLEREIFNLRYSLYLRAVDSEDTDLQAQWPNPYGERLTRTRTKYL